MKASHSAEARSSTSSRGFKDADNGNFHGLEHEAAKIQEYTVGLVPALLQHRDCIKPMMARRYVPDEAERARRVEARLQQHANVLEREKPPRIWMILDEPCLRCVTGDTGVTNTRLEHPLQLAARPSINLQVPPSTAGMSPTYGSSMLTFDETDGALVIDFPPDGLFFADREDLWEHEIALNRLQASALPTVEMRTLLKTLITEYKRLSRLRARPPTPPSLPLAGTRRATPTAGAPVWRSPKGRPRACGTPRTAKREPSSSAARRGRPSWGTARDDPAWSTSPVRCVPVDRGTPLPGHPRIPRTPLVGP